MKNTPRAPQALAGRLTELLHTIDGAATGVVACASKLYGHLDPSFERLGPQDEAALEAVQGELPSIREEDTCEDEAESPATSPLRAYTCPATTLRAYTCSAPPLLLRC